MSVVTAAVGPTAYWYLTRSTGAVALILLTFTVALGVIDAERWSSPAWPRFVTDAVHRNLSLLALIFLVIHVLTAVLDSFAPIALTDGVIPFDGRYRPLWLGLGAVSFDLILAVLLTTLLRQRIGYASWRAVHWLSYLSWPIALVHSYGTGSDVKSGWMLWLGIACLAIVVTAILVRALDGWPRRAALRGTAIAITGGFSLFLVFWLPGGPLGSEWPRRSGTPSALLPHHHAAAAALR
jgi:predicted ferric reductase